MQDFWSEDDNPDLSECIAGIFLGRRREIGAWEEPNGGQRNAARWQFLAWWTRARPVTVLRPGPAPDVRHRTTPIRREIQRARRGRSGESCSRMLASMTHAFDVIHITNELPSGRLGGVGTVIDGLISGFRKLGLRVLWFHLDDDVTPGEIANSIGAGATMWAGTLGDLRQFSAPVLHIHCYQPHQRLLEICRDHPSIYTIHSLLNWEARSNDIDLTDSIRWQEQLIAAVDRVAVISEAEREAYTALGYSVSTRTCALSATACAIRARSGLRAGPERSDFADGLFRESGRSSRRSFSMRPVSKRAGP